MKKATVLFAAIALTAVSCGHKGPHDVLYPADEATLNEAQLKSLQEIGVDVISADSTVCDDSAVLALVPGVSDERATELKAVLRFTLPDVTPRVEVLLPCCPSCGKGAFYKELIAFRHTHPALDGGDYAEVEDQWVPDDVFAFTRSKGRETIMVLANLSDSYTETALPDAQKWVDAFSPEVYDDELNCPVIAPWGWRILIRK